MPVDEKSGFAGWVTDPRAAWLSGLRARAMQPLLPAATSGRGSHSVKMCRARNAEPQVAVRRELRRHKSDSIPKEPADFQEISEAF